MNISSSLSSSITTPRSVAATQALSFADQVLSKVNKKSDTQHIINQYIHNENIKQKSQNTVQKKQKIQQTTTVAKNVNGK